jgi:hypothetical protein
MDNDENTSESDESSDELDVCLFTPRDEEIVAAAVVLLEKIIRSPVGSAAQIASVAKALHVLKRLPQPTPGVTVSVSLTGPRRWYGEHEIYHWWEVTVEDLVVGISSCGYFYRQSTGGDSFTLMQWSAQPGMGSDFSDYLAQHWIVDDAKPFEQDVGEIELSEPGYSLEVIDDENPLLEQDLDEPA